MHRRSVVLVEDTYMMEAVVRSSIKEKLEYMVVLLFEIQTFATCYAHLRAKSIFSCSRGIV